MTVKTILAVLSDPDTAPGVLETAIMLCNQNNGHLIALYAEAPEQVFIYAPMEVPSAAAISAMQEAANERADKIETAFRDRVQREGVSYEWRKFLTQGGFSSSGVIDSARSADIVVCGQLDDKTPTALRADIELLIFECGRPVLMVPYILKTPKPVERALIAWNGSREASRAVFDALPLLSGAKEIEILSVDARNNSAQTADLAGSELAATLTRHGMKVNVNNIVSGGTPVGAVIENRVADLSADLLIMGAYTHSRLRERLFGGATSTLLSSMTTLTLMSR